MNNELLLITGKDIPFPEAQITIHQPTINEISLIGEENFHAGCQFINFNKEKLSPQDKIGLEDKSNFDIFMSIMCSKEQMQYKESVILILSLIFPDYKIKFMPNFIALANNNNTARIDSQNFEAFKDILNAMFCLEESESAAGTYNPIDARAQKIADKFNKRKEKIAQSKGDSKKVAVFSRYVSILAVGLCKDMNTLNNYTVFQLKDEFKRFVKKQDFDFYIEAKKAGAENLEEVDTWMDDIHP